MKNSQKKSEFWLKWKSSFSMKILQKKLSFYKEFLLLDKILNFQTANEALIRFLSIFHVKSYEIQDFIYRKKTGSFFSEEEIQENIDFTLFSKEETLIFLENHKEKYNFKIKHEENYIENDYYAIISRKNRFFTILSIEKNVKNNDFLCFEPEILMFFSNLVENLRRKKFEVISKNFLKEIQKNKQIINIISEFLQAIFKENFIFRIFLYNQKKNKVLLNEKIEKNGVLQEFSKKGLDFLINYFY